jgi:hypothetical protein
VGIFIMEEIWKDVPGYEGLYQASIFGQIRRLPKERPFGRFGIKKYPLVILVSEITKRGYHRVTLTKDNKSIKFALHRLVAISFIPNLANKPQVNHKDGNKDNNAKSNLEWSTALENNQHSCLNKLWDERGEKCHLSKLDNTKVLEIRKSGIDARELSKMYNVHYSTIRRIINNIIWTHI